jgi:hypothetical protein
MARITVDDTEIYDVDFYTPANLHRQIVWSLRGLPAGEHKLKIEYLDDRNPASIGNLIGFDAIDVEGTLKQASPSNLVNAVRLEESHPGIVFSTAWTHATSTLRSGAAWAWSRDTNASAAFSFDGTGVELLSTVGPDYGFGLVSLDGGVPQIVNYYSPTYLHQQIVWGAYNLTAGLHHLELTSAGDADERSSGVLIGLDAVDIQGSLQQ